MSSKFVHITHLKSLTLLTAMSVNLLASNNVFAADKAVFDASAKGTNAVGTADTMRGKGDETHQTAGNNLPTMTTQQGIPVSDDQNSLKVGTEGPALLEDFVMREKIFHFDHERIPERVVHARGVGAHGYFEVYKPLTELSKADVFQHPGVKTPVFVRFSTVAGSEGSTDMARDVRGFCCQVLHQGRKLGSRRKQHSSLFHSRRYEIS